jgi:hypothetical protein
MGFLFHISNYIAYTARVFTVGDFDADIDTMTNGYSTLRVTHLRRAPDIDFSNDTSEDISHFVLLFGNRWWK